MKVEIDNYFAGIDGVPRSKVFEVFPSVFGDKRGFFCEVYKTEAGLPFGAEWFNNFSWIKQVNRSSSGPGVIRGMHAQKKDFCQGKLVSALTEKIYDIIIDARPESATFGKSKAYVLDPMKQNMLWVPRGFLHGFVTPLNITSPAIFEYFCDNVYDKVSETGIAPMSFLPDFISSLEYSANHGPDSFIRKWYTETYSDLFDVFHAENRPNLSPKDTAAQDYKVWSDAIQADYKTTGKVWYR